MSKLSEVKQVYGETMAELGGENGKIFVVEADLMKASGSLPFKEKFPDRHINVGIAEQNLVGVAAGIAAAEGIPYACTMSNFLSQRACDQVAMSVSYNCFNVKLVGCYAGLTQEKNGGTHISIMDLAVMRCLPNMTVMVPGDCKEYAQILRTASNHVGPAYLRMPKLLADDIFDASHKFEIGRGYVFGSGADVTIITTGITTAIGFEALPLLESEGIAARLLHLPTLKPIDGDTLVDCAKATGAVLTVENHSRLGGLGSLVSEFLSKEYPVPVCRLGFDDQFGLTADLAFQLKYFGLTAEDILANAKELISKKKSA